MGNYELREWLGLTFADLLVFLAAVAIVAMFFVSDGTLHIVLASIGILLAVAACPFGMKRDPRVSGFTNIAKRVTYPVFVLLALGATTAHYLWDSGFIAEYIYSKYDIPLTPEARLDHSLKALASARSERDRFYALNDAAKQSFEFERIPDARTYAEELLVLAPRFTRNWNYGNAIQDANLVLGRIAVREGRIDDAKAYLRASGRSPGSPQMNTFGPDMSLANDLLEKGERDVVLEYFDLCRKFWEMHEGRLDIWAREVREGKIPRFERNLLY